MAIPTVTSIDPDIGHTGGKQHVEIIGTNFRLPTPQTNPTGPLPVAPPSVQVDIDGVLCTNVAVLSDTRLFCITGVRTEGTDLTVTVTNIDDNGDPIAGEAGSLVDAYSYRRPQLTDASALLTLIRNLIIDLRRQIHPSVSLTVNTDFDDTTTDLLNIAKIASVPSLVLNGPMLEENRFYSVNELPQEELLPSEEFRQRRELYTVDVLFDYVGVSNSKQEHINLSNVVIAYFKKNKTIKHPISGEDLEMEFDIGGEPKATPRSGNDNLRVFRGSFLIRGVDVGEFPGFEQDQVVDATKRLLDQDDFAELQETTQLGQTFGVGTITFTPPAAGKPYPAFPKGAGSRKC